MAKIPHSMVISKANVLKKIKRTYSCKKCLKPEKSKKGKISPWTRHTLNGWLIWHQVFPGWSSTKHSFVSIAQDMAKASHALSQNSRQMGSSQTRQQQYTLQPPKCCTSINIKQAYCSHFKLPAYPVSSQTSLRIQNSFNASAHTHLRWGKGDKVILGPGLK